MVNHKQMQSRCSDSHFVKRAHLKGYKLIYDGNSITRKGAVANVVKKDDSIVWGGLFEINEYDRASLDRYEGYPRSYNRKSVQIIDDEGNQYEAITYYRTGKQIGVPSEEYRSIIKQGARDCDLPEEYVKNNI